jgi:hypothetical protein
MTDQNKPDISSVARATRQEIITQRGDSAETLALCEAIDDFIETFVEVGGEGGPDAEALYSDLLLSLQEADR